MLGSFLLSRYLRRAALLNLLLMMRAGSIKKLHPETAFHAADTDKDGKLTLQELGVMLYLLLSKKTLNHPRIKPARAGRGPLAPLATPDTVRACVGCRLAVPEDFYFLF